MVVNSRVCREGDGFSAYSQSSFTFYFQVEGWGVRKFKECTSKEEEGE